ncbi:MAG: flavodoxin family protein, partial [Ruminococcus sp.]
NLMVWLPDNAAYLGMFLCQGSVSPEQGQKFRQMMPEAADQLENMLREGSSHPDAGDLEKAAQFALQMQASAAEEVFVKEDA